MTDLSGGEGWGCLSRLVSLVLLFMPVPLAVLLGLLGLQLCLELAEALHLATRSLHPSFPAAYTAADSAQTPPDIDKGRVWRQCDTSCGFSEYQLSRPLIDGSKLA